MPRARQVKPNPFERCDVAARGAPTSPMTHVHIGGTSKLGLGLVVPAAGAAGLKSHLLVRMSPNESSKSEALARRLHASRRFHVRTPSGFTEHTFEQVAPIYGEYGAPSRTLVDLISNADTALLTTSIGDGLTDERIATAIAQGLLARRQSGVTQPLTIIACENTRSSLWLRRRMFRANSCLPPQKQFELISHARFIPCVIDRACTDISITANGVIEVAASDDANWYMQRGAPSDLEMRLSRNDAIDTQYCSRIDLLWQIKLWAANGLHLATAMRAHQDGAESTLTYLRSAGGRETFDGIYREIRRLLSVVLPAKTRESWTQILSRAAHHLQTHEDSVARILRLGLREAAAFERNTYFKLGLPLELYAQAGGSLSAVRIVASLVGDLSKRSRAPSWRQDFCDSLQVSEAGSILAEGTGTRYKRDAEHPRIASSYYFSENRNYITA